MKIETYIFDLDGTLLNTLADLTKSVNYALSLFEFPQHTESEICSFIGNGVEKLIKRAVPKYVEPEITKNVLKMFGDYYKVHCADNTLPYGDIVSVVAKLAAQGCKIAVVSNKSHEETEILIRKFFGSSVSFILGSKPNFPKKPEPNMVLAAISALNANPKTTVYIGDSDVDVKTANNVGIKSVGVSWGFRGREFLAKAQADIIVDNPCELLKIGK
ncbi:MAG: HAD family hydrolase [Clostridiales bacterium]